MAGRKPMTRRITLRLLKSPSRQDAKPQSFKTLFSAPLRLCARFFFQPYAQPQNRSKKSLAQRRKDAKFLNPFSAPLREIFYLWIISKLVGDPIGFKGSRILRIPAFPHLHIVFHPNHPTPKVSSKSSMPSGIDLNIPAFQHSRILLFQYCG